MVRSNTVWYQDFPVFETSKFQLLLTYFHCEINHRREKWHKDAAHVKKSHLMDCRLWIHIELIFHKAEYELNMHTHTHAPHKHKVTQYCGSNRPEDLCSATENFNLNGKSPNKMKKRCLCKLLLNNLFHVFRGSCTTGIYYRPRQWAAKSVPTYVTSVTFTTMASKYCCCKP